jgi:hypothetical protein
MAIESPSCLWPTILEERGPSDDPTILLTGTGLIGETPIQIVAIRINPSFRSTPDYKPNQANDLDSALGAILEELEYASAELASILGEEHSGAIELATGFYKVWTLSASFGAQPHNFASK